MKGFMRFLWLLSGVLLIACGIMFLFMPGATLLSIAIYIGIGTLIAGVTGCAAYFTDKRRLPGSGWLLFEAILDILLGVLLLSSGAWAMIAVLLPAMFSLWIIIKGFIGVIDAIESRHYMGNQWVASLIVAIVFIALGILALINPEISIFTIAVICAMGFIWSGIATISMWSKQRQLRKRVKQWKERLENDEAGFARDYPVAYQLLKRRIIEGEFDEGD